jgi:hypothetical protein
MEAIAFEQRFVLQLCLFWKVKISVKSLFNQDFGVEGAQLGG